MSCELSRVKLYDPRRPYLPLLKHYAEVDVNDFSRFFVNKYVAAVAITYPENVTDNAVNSNRSSVLLLRCVPHHGVAESLNEKKSKTSRVMLTYLVKYMAPFVLRAVLQQVPTNAVAPFPRVIFRVEAHFRFFSAFVCNDIQNWNSILNPLHYLIALRTKKGLSFA